MHFYGVLVLSCVYVITKGDRVFPCTTPNKEDAYCVPLSSCPNILNLLETLEPSSIDFVHRSICHGHEANNVQQCTCGDIMVCCATPKDQIEIQYTQSQSAKRKLLPDLSYCGLQHADERYRNDIDTALDEFPWLVQIRHHNINYDREFADRCTGVIINDRYVLTSVDCGSLAITVFLGQYSANRNVTCVENSEILECTNPTIQVQVAEKLNKIESGMYGFTLLRLAEKLNYTDFIRPICLPMNETMRPKHHDSLMFSGWGVPTKEVSPSKQIKKKRLTYDVVNAEVCFERRFWLAQNIICVTPQKNNTRPACTGEHGGPFMYSQGGHWFLEGIIVDVTVDEDTECSIEKEVKGIRITPQTINWILDSIRY